MITFEYEGVKYEVDLEAYESGKIILPDGTLLEIETWTKADSPTPLVVHRIQHNYLYTDLKDLANHFDAVLAEAVE